MSTSIVVKNMEKAAKKENIDAKIWAVPEVEIESEKDKADIILLGPQVRFLENDIKKKVNNRIPVDVINMMDYGRMDGQKILKQALDRLGGKK
jgi:PTS system cellobiose-specific IIB component